MAPTGLGNYQRPYTQQWNDPLYSVTFITEYITGSGSHLSRILAALIIRRSGSRNHSCAAVLHNPDNHDELRKQDVTGLLPSGSHVLAFFGDVHGALLAVALTAMLCLEPNTLFLSLLYPQTQILLSQFHLQLFFLCHRGFRFFSSQHGSAQISVLSPKCLSCIVTCFSSLLYSQVWVSSALSHGGVGNGLSSRGRGAAPVV